jgi:azurin
LRRVKSDAAVIRMKMHWGIVFAAIIALCGCGRDTSRVAGPSPATPEETAVQPGTPGAPREVRIEVGDSMKFSVTRIEAAAGETLRLVLVNKGSAPKEAMGHNWVLLRPGADAKAYAQAAVGARAADYLPPDRAADVLAHTKLLGGGGRDAVVFTVPADAAPGTEMVFLCTFPAHLQLGMRGVLAVR